MKLTLLITILLGISLLLLSIRLAGAKSTGCHGGHNVPARARRNSNRIKTE